MLCERNESESMSNIGDVSKSHFLLCAKTQEDVYYIIMLKDFTLLVLEYSIICVCLTEISKGRPDKFSISNRHFTQIHLNDCIFHIDY